MGFKYYFLDFFLPNYVASLEGCPDPMSGPIHHIRL